MRFFNNPNRYSAAYNNVSCNKYGLFLMERPNIPTAEDRIEEYEVLGKDGKMYIETGEVKDRDFPIKIGFFGSPSQWTDKYRAIKTWLQTPQPTILPFNTLQLADDTKYYYKVKKITLDTTEREAIDIGQAIVTLTVDGYNFKRQGFQAFPFLSTEQYNTQQQNWNPIIEFKASNTASDGEIIITGGRIEPNYGLTSERTLEVSIGAGETITLNLAVPIATVIINDGGEPRTEEAFSRLKGDFETLISAYTIAWETRGDLVAGDITATIKPLYKEK